MKKTVFILSALFFIASCGSSDETGFLSPSKPTAGDAGQKLVQVEIKVGVSDGKGGQRRSKPSTGGAPSAKGSGPESQETGDETASGESEPDGIPLPYREKVTLDENGKEKSGKKVDILFYLGAKWHGACWKSLGLSIDHSHFFPHLNKFDWQVAAAFTSHDPELYNIRDEGGAHLYDKESGFWDPDKIYVLKKGQFSSKESDKSLKGTITVEYKRYLHYGNGKGGQKTNDELKRGVPYFLPLHKKAPTDPLWGLSKLLKENPEGFARSKSNTFVVMMDSTYYYTTKEWQDFIRKREDIQFISLTSRMRPVSNHLPILESENFKWIPCGNAHDASSLAKYIKKSVR